MQDVIFFGAALLFFIVSIIDIVAGWFRDRM